MNPYSKLPTRSFWKPSVAEVSMFDIQDLWSPKFNIKQNDKVSTYGSCFAQHIGKALQAEGFNWFIPEQPPLGMTDKNGRLFNYNIFSSRTGNIYTSSLLKQWTRWALNEDQAPNEIWEKEGRFFDPFRPVVEPKGFESAEELLASRKETIKYFKESILSANYFVFTLGLTESWFNAIESYEYPMCPGTSAGSFDENIHVFKNQQFSEVLGSLRDAIMLMRAHNKNLKFILTVSPVPLTATYSDKHVLVATMESKSILRAVAAQLSNSYKFIDYFPSYEIINAPPYKGAFFEPNLRSVNPAGVAFVMGNFFKGLTNKFGQKAPTMKTNDSNTSHNDIVCEEEILESFRG